MRYDSFQHFIYFVFLLRFCSNEMIAALSYELSLAVSIPKRQEQHSHTNGFIIYNFCCRRWLPSFSTGLAHFSLWFRAMFSKWFPIFVNVCVCVCWSCLLIASWIGLISVYISYSVKSHGSSITTQATWIEREKERPTTNPERSANIVKQAENM